MEIAASVFELRLRSGRLPGPGPGGRAGCDITLAFSPAVDAGFFAELRYVRFGYKEDLLEGDTYAGGLGVVAGLSAAFRF